VLTNAPTVLTNNGFTFDALLKASASNSVVSTSIVPPQGPATTLSTNSDGTQLELRSKLDSQSALDSAFPDGTYAINIVGVSQGSRTVSALLTGALYPSAPQFLNASSAQTIDAEEDFVFQWEPFAGGKSSDYIQLQIEDASGNNVFETPDLGKAQTLTGLQSSTKIPAHTLNPGTAYLAKLRFLRIVDLDTSSYPRALGVSGFGSQTRLSVATALAPAPELGKWQYSIQQGFACSVLGTSDQIYRVEASADLLHWATIGTVTLTNGEARFGDPASGLYGHRFYRATQP